MNRQAGLTQVQGSTAKQVWVRFGGKTRLAGRLEERDMIDLGTEVYLVSEGRRSRLGRLVWMVEGTTIHFIVRMRGGG